MYIGKIKHVQPNSYLHFFSLYCFSNKILNRAQYTVWYDHTILGVSAQKTNLGLRKILYQMLIAKAITHQNSGKLT